MECCGGEKASGEAVEQQLGSLPPELVEHLWSFLPLRDLLRVSLVCRDWQALASSPSFWRFVYEHRLGAPVREDLPVGGATEPGDHYRPMVEKTVAQLQAKLLLTTEQLAKRGANKENNSSDGESPQPDKPYDASGGAVVAAKRELDLSSYAEWDAESALLMEEFVWAMHEKHHRLVDDVLRRMDVLGIKRTIFELMNATKRSVVEDKWRRTPLHRAAEAGNLEVVRVLLAHGIDVNARNEWGWTALHKAAHYWNRGAAAPIIKMLIAHGAEVNVIDCAQKTPLDKAAEPASAELLAAHGALKRNQLPSDAALLCAIQEKIDGRT